MSKLNNILISVIVVLLIVLGIVIYWQNGGFEKNYWAVYLDSGDLYFGKLSNFPQLSLTDVWFLQSNLNNEENSFGIEKLTNVFWGPKNQLYLNQENIIWKVELEDDSQVVQFIKSNQNQNKETTEEGLEDLKDLENLEENESSDSNSQLNK